MGHAPALLKIDAWLASVKPPATEEMTAATNIEVS
jgi:hypothetical protein